MVSYEASTLLSLAMSSVYVRNSYMVQGKLKHYLTWHACAKLPQMEIT